MLSMRPDNYMCKVHFSKIHFVGSLMFTLSRNDDLDTKEETLLNGIIVSRECEFSFNDVKFWADEKYTQPYTGGDNVWITGITCDCG